MNLRRVTGGLLFAAIVAGGVDLRNLASLVGDSRRRAAFLASSTDRRAPDYPRFLQEVARRTRPGESIAIVFPPRGYDYAFYRASYFLAGRRVIPLFDRDGRFHAERGREADYFAFWSVAPPPRTVVVWQGHRGSLVRGRR